MASVGYARVSTAGQSLESQLEALRACDKVFQEKESGAKAERPQLVAMLGYVRDGDTIAVTKLCRLARNTKHLLEVVDYLEQQLLLERQAEGIAIAKTKGKYLGRKPLSVKKSNRFKEW